MDKRNVIIALAGKGGVGKTSVAAAFVRLISEMYPGKRILAVDADPAVGLATALGTEPVMTLDDIRNEIIKFAGNGDNRMAAELLSEARFRIFDAMTETDKFSFLAIGRPESSGCYCKVNAYLKEVISMIAEDFDFVIIDGEAGIEQINRRVMEKVTHLVLVSDTSRKGINVARTISSVAYGLVMYEKCGLIINRITDNALCKMLDTDGIGVLSLIESDNSQTVNDALGASVFNLPVNSPLLKGAKAALVTLLAENKNGTV